MSGFVRVAEGAESWSGHERTPRHRHDRPYAALVLSGGYEESGSRGRFRVRPGQVLLHRAFDAHLNRFEALGARVLNLRLEDDPGYAIGTVAEPDGIVHLARSDPSTAAEMLCLQLRPAPIAARDWPDLLAADLAADPQMRLDHWARRRGLAAETLSRGFCKAFSISPAAFRAEARAHRAFAEIAGAALPLAAVAAAAGFADQAHMTRAIRALTGRPPGYWRRSSRLETGRRASP
jgi:AraC-like DNA-binding protein